VTLKVVATGPLPITYQWRLNGRELPGQTNSMLTFDVVDARSFGLYEVVVEEPDMAIVSEPAVVRPAGTQSIAADNFAERRMLEANNGSLHSTTFGAKAEPGEPMSTDLPGGRSVWFAWHPTEPGIATFDTFGSGFDTLLAVYEGTSLMSLQRVAADDDSTDELWSRVQFNASPSVEYLIAVDGLAAAGGFVTLNWNLEITSQTVPVIVKQPEDVVVMPNQTAVFTVNATDPGPLSLTYQWFKNGEPVPGQAAADFAVPQAQLADVAEYYVVVDNGQRAVQSRPVTLQLATDPSELKFVRKLAFDFICGTDFGNVPTPDRKAKVPVLKIAPSSSGTIASSSITTYSGGAGSPPYICKRRTYYKWTAVTTDCAVGQSTTMTFNLTGSSGLGNTTMAAYYITTDLYLACAQASSPSLPSVSFTAEPGKTYRVLVGKSNSGGTIVLNYSNSACAP